MSTRAADLLLSSRVVLAEEAEQIGLVNRALAPTDLLPHTYAYAAPAGVGDRAVLGGGHEAAALP